jgi:hypothetical protein
LLFDFRNGAIIKTGSVIAALLNQTYFRKVPTLLEKIVLAVDGTIDFSSLGNWKLF